MAGFTVCNIIHGTLQSVPKYKEFVKSFNYMQLPDDAPQKGQRNPVITGSCCPVENCFS
jgi:hypothetical protein